MIEVNQGDTVLTYKEGLNPRQLEAVESLDGPLLVLAGAGSGKTKTLTTRIAHILCTNRAWPSEILAVTFTNRAAREMRQRVEEMAHLKTETLPWLGTFHSICARILRRHAELVGLTSRFTILDTDDQLRLLKQIIKAERIDEKRWPARHLGGLIDMWKNRCLLPDQLPENEREKFGGRAFGLYEQYQARLESLNATDFGDLIVLVVKLLRENADLLELYRRRFKFILVDEYQDTNTAQYLWLQLLAQSHRNICCVGDDDQSIYGWRGAEIENILRFEAHFQGAKVVRLEQNYRSTEHILAAASEVISHNHGRLGKVLWTQEKGGEKVRVMGCMNPESEARWITGEIEKLSEGRGPLPAHPFSDMAVLVRAAFQMRHIEERFLKIGVPYRVIGGPRFYERREIRDALAYFRLAHSANDDLAFERVVNTPKRGVGAKTLLTIQNKARESKCSMLAVSRHMSHDNEFKGRAAVAMAEFINSVDTWSKMIAENKKPLEDIGGQVIDETGLPEMLKREKTPEAEGRLENLKELVKSLKEFSNMAGFLEHVSLVYENLEDIETSKVSLMTLHAVKGLEFPITFLPGWEEDIFPLRRAIEENRQGVEEERRLAYVGLTRARKLCHISFCATRFLYGEGGANHVSRFVDELPPDNIEIVSPSGIFNSYQGQQSSTATGRSQLPTNENSGGYMSPGFQRLSQASKRLSHSRPSARQKKFEEIYEVGERVFNIKFGYGEVIEVSDNKLLIEFEQTGSKRVIASHVQKANGTEG